MDTVFRIDDVAQRFANLFSREVAEEDEVSLGDDVLDDDVDEGIEEETPPVEEESDLDFMDTNGKQEYEE